MKLGLSFNAVYSNERRENFSWGAGCRCAHRRHHCAPEADA